MPKQWHVITGSPSSGKTSLLKELEKRGYSTVEEMGRKLIDQKLAAGYNLEQIKVDSPEFESAWVEMQVAAEASLDKSALIFFDRGVIDTLAYFKFYGWPVPEAIEQAVNHASYGKVFLLELLEYESDYARVESHETAKAMQKLFARAYKDAGYEVIVIPRATIEDRASLILNNI